MEARVKKDSKLKTITAFGGLAYSPLEFRPVPPGCEGEAEANPFLEVREEGNAVAEAVSAVEVTAPPEEGEIEDAPEFDASPSAVELADELGVDLASVEGSGAGGKIIKSDVAKFVKED